MNKPKKRGRPIAIDWVSPDMAAAKLGLSRRALLNLRPSLSRGLHYRCINPKAAKNGRRYLFHLKRVDAFLTEG
jgi:hypothetical protein